VNAKNLPAEYTIDAEIVAQPFINGTGFIFKSIKLQMEFNGQTSTFHGH
jgi:hypothetical protein